MKKQFIAQEIITKIRNLSEAARDTNNCHIFQLQLDTKFDRKNWFFVGYTILPDTKLFYKKVLTNDGYNEYLYTEKYDSHSGIQQDRYLLTPYIIDLVFPTPDWAFEQDEPDIDDLIQEEADRQESLRETEVDENPEEQFEAPEDEVSLALTRRFRIIDLLVLGVRTMNTNLLDGCDCPVTRLKLNNQILLLNQENATLYNPTREDVHEFELFCLDIIDNMQSIYIKGGK